MPLQFNDSFFRERVRLSPGGQFDFDAVNVNKTIAAAISTSGARTASGKNAVGKMNKIYHDLYFLLLSEVERKIMIFTEEDMYMKCLEVRELGRIPGNIEFYLASIPDDLRIKLEKARLKASQEVTPQ